MRLAAQGKMGFYPASPVALDALCRHLKLNDEKPDHVCILDPCAGQGLAINQIAATLEVPRDRVYAIELDAGRAQNCKENLPGSNVLGPASFAGTQMTSASIGLIYLNPPFDSELGGGRREEEGFARRAIWLLCPGGVMALVLPYGALMGNRSIVSFLDSNLEDIRLYSFPVAVRPFRELVVLGRKRAVSLPTDEVERNGDLHKMEIQWRTYLDIELITELGQPYTPIYNGRRAREMTEQGLATYAVPHCWKPHTFKKSGYTEEELALVLAGSPLNRILEETPPMPLKRPPLPPGRGHVAMLLASGMLDGLVESHAGNHVVRGTACKEEYTNKPECSRTEDAEKGSTTTKTVISQRIVLSIRAVADDGEIRTFSNTLVEDDANDDSDSDTVSLSSR